ncbi:MAG: PilN domain-containing protein, partial [Kiritimatiellae bacterium]|nr:PilN domain-containing protein [Kiritimatiellia bacterium]
RVLLGIVQRHVAEERFYLVEKGGLAVGRMALSTEGVLAWYREAVQRQPGAPGVDIVLDVDSTHSEFLVIAAGDLLFTRSIPIGANQLLAATQTLGDKLAMEIRVALDAFHGERPDVTPTRIILSGAACNIRGLDSLLGSALRIPTETRNSLAAIRQWPASPSLQSEQYRPVSLTALVGMGLAPHTLQFNLIPESVVMKRNLARKAASLTNFACLVMTLLFSISGLTAVNLCFRKSFLDVLRARRRATEPVAQNVERMVEVIKLVRERRDPRQTPLSVLYELAAAAPRDEVVFDTVRIDCEKRQVVLQGMAMSRGVVATLVQNLRKSPMFADDVKEAGPTTADRSGRFRFLINASLESEP